jgi:phospholipase C
MPKIEHVVVLMLENRSFDSMLGRLYPKSASFDGLDGSESNPLHKADGTVERIGVWNSRELTSEAACIPDPDPGELFEDMNVQLFGLHGTPGQPAGATMDGFVDNYMRQPPTDRPYDPRAVMHYLTPQQVPVMAELARAFGVSDRWHASAPCETWPNRYFAHCGTAGGWVNNERSRFPYRWPRAMPTVFRRLERAGYSWKVYFHDLPQTATLCDLWFKIPTHFCLFEAEFARHVRTNRLPNYSFIEPRYYASWLARNAPNDQHPPHNLLYGEQLIAAVYNALRNGPRWDRTLLIITYDEHGGCFDHVPPPAAMSPGGPSPDGFVFDRYGVRVPALLISPYIAPGSIIRPPPDAKFPFEHASIPATLHRLFDIGEPLTPRIAAVPDLLGALTLSGPDNPGPREVHANPLRPSRREIREHRRRPHNNHQRHLRSVALGVPAAAAGAAAAVRGAGAKLVPERLRRR